MEFAYIVRMISRQQIKAARGMLEWTQGDVAERAGLSLSGYNAIERGDARPRKSNLDAIRRVLEKAGVIFIDGNADGPGVRLRR